MFSFLDKENNEGKWKDNKWCWPHVVPQVSHMSIHIVYVAEKKLELMTNLHTHL